MNLIKIVEGIAFLSLNIGVPITTSYYFLSLRKNYQLAQFFLGGVPIYIAVVLLFMYTKTIYVSWWIGINTWALFPAIASIQLIYYVRLNRWYIISIQFLLALFTYSYWLGTNSWAH